MGGGGRASREEGEEGEKVEKQRCLSAVRELLEKAEGVKVRMQG